MTVGGTDAPANENVAPK